MINRAKVQLQNEAVNTISDLKREQRAMKNKQYIGVDSITYKSSIENSFSQLVPAGMTMWRLLRFYPVVSAEFVSELGLHIYIDTDNDDNYRLPLGPSLTSAQRQCRPGGIFYDHHEGVITDKWYMVPLTNGDTVDHTFYGHFVIILSVGAIAS